MRGLFRAVLFTMVVTMAGGLASPSAATAFTQESVIQPVGMVSGPWRMMAWQFAFAPEFPEQELEARDGSNWGILIADMTNTGVDGALAVANVLLGDSEVAGDAEQSVRVSRALGFNAIADDGSLPVPENGIARVAVVMDVPEGVGKPAIRIGDQIAGIESVMTETLDLSGLPEATTGMQLEMGTVAAVPSAKTLTVAMQSGETREVALETVQAPPAEGCYGPESIQVVNETTGGTVWVETVPGVESPTVWFNDAENATFGLLEFTLVSVGAAGVEDAGTYSSWLTPIAVDNESSGVGLWDNCRGVGGEYINPPTPTPVPTPSAEEVRKAYTWADTRDLTTRPFMFEGEKIAVAGEVFTLQVDQDGTFMQIWVDTPSGREAVVVVAFGNQSPGLYEGMWVTVYGTGQGVFSGTNSFGGTITQPLIRADIVDY